jgi:hypothetical protein
MELTTHTSRNVRAASTVTLVAAIWLFVSPWIYSVYRLPNAWNSWIVGLAIAALAAIRIGSPGRVPVVKLAKLPPGCMDAGVAMDLRIYG